MLSSTSPCHVEPVETCSSRYRLAFDKLRLTDSASNSNFSKIQRLLHSIATGQTLANTAKRCHVEPVETCSSRYKLAFDKLRLTDSASDSNFSKL
jgi:hypothetical protein